MKGCLGLRPKPQNTDVLTQEDLGLMVGASGGVGPEGGLLGKDEGAIVHC